MTWTEKFFGLAEAAAFDMRGQITASGLVPALITVDSFPAQIGPWVILVLENSEQIEDPPRSANLRVEVLGPEGEALVAIQQELPLPQPANPIKGLPARAQVAAQLPMQVPKKGDYTVRLTLDLKAYGSSSHELKISIWDQQSVRAAQES
jgi:hypothetical protein